MIDDSRAEQAPEPEAAADLKPLEVPWLYASRFQIQGTGTDFNLILQRSRPLRDADGRPDAKNLELVAVAVLTMSPQATKDLSLVLKGVIERHEADFGGPIETPFTKRRAAEQKQAGATTPEA
jgi:hypothetical protein